MKNLIGVLFIIIAFNGASSQSYNIGDTVFVWANQELKVKQSPSFKSKTVTSIKSGLPIIVKQFTSKNAVQNLFNQSEYEKHPVQIRGKWIKIKIDEKEGFVNDAFLLKLPNSNFSSLTKFLNPLILSSDTLGIIGKNCISFKANCLYEINYKTTCTELYSEIEITFDNWDLSRVLIFIDYFEKISKSINDNGKMKLHRNWQNIIEITDNMYSYIFKKIDNRIEVIITWSC